MSSTSLPRLRFELPDGTIRTVTVSNLFNAGYAGRDQAEVQAHIAELAELGVPGPSITPTLYPVSAYLAQQTDRIQVQHAKTSGEAEWALLIDDTGDVLLTVACDHTDRQLEVHGVAWSKNAAPDVMARQAWRLDDVRDHLDAIALRAWVGHQGNKELIQDSTVGALLDPDYWLDVLQRRNLAVPGTVLLSGTVTMLEGIDQFGDSWIVEMSDPVTRDVLKLSYDVELMPEPIG